MAVQNGQFKHWSEKQCNEIITEHKDSTQYFNEQMTFDEAYNMFRLHYEFGEAETKVIMAALMKAGAKFRQCEGEWKLCSIKSMYRYMDNTFLKRT